MNDRDKGIELCSAKVEHLRNQLRMVGQNQQEVRNMAEETESAEYQAAVKKLRSLSSSWESYLERKPSLEAVQSLVDELTDEQAVEDQAVEELRIIGGLTNPRRR